MLNCIKFFKNVNEFLIVIILGLVNGIEIDIYIDSGFIILVIIEIFV